MIVLRVITPCSRVCFDVSEERRKKFSMWFKNPRNDCHLNNLSGNLKTSVFDEL